MAIGKKVVEEAAESWMAAEHEGPERAAEEISQLLYRAQVLMLAPGSIPYKTSTATCKGNPTVLRIAIPNKGTLSRPASEMLREAGYRQRTDERDLTCLDSDNDVEFFYLRPRDIATYVDSGDLDLGITGQDLLVDSGSPVRELLELGFAAGDLPLRRARPGDDRPRRAADRHLLSRAWSSATWPNARSRPRSSSSTAPWRTRCGWASPTSSPTWWPPARRCARPG